MHRLRTVAAALTLAAFASVQAQTLPNGFVTDTLVSAGLGAPHDFCFLPDGRILIANRSGSVSLYAGTPTVVTVGSVPSILTGSERGLLSIEPDPAFATNGHIYVWYSSTADGYMHLDRLTCTGNLSSSSSTNLSFAASSRREVLNAVPDNAFNHNGGSLRFGPDGMLYLSIGDDASSCTAQSLTSSSGCVLRMDVSGLPAGGSTTAPSFATLDPGDNPLSSNNGVEQLVIAYGLRNPFRMEIDQVTGNLYIADVGQSSIEELDEYVYPATGALPLVNFGWPWREGTLSYSSCGGSMPVVTAPIDEMSHQGTGWGSIIGGPRYRNQGGTFDFGPAYEDVVFFTDYFAGEVRALTQSGSNWTTLPPVAGQPGSWWGTGFQALTSMRQGPDGALYFTQHAGGYVWSGGTLERIRPLAPQNNVVTVSGAGQRVSIGEVFPQPLVAQVLDPSSNPIPFGTVNFAVQGGAVLSTTNPVTSNANGHAQTTVTATAAGGSITVTASTPGAGATGSFSLFARKLGVINSGNLVVLSIVNETSAAPPQVPYIVLCGFPGVTSWASPFGTICTDPASPFTFAVEDASGIFGFFSLSGTGGIGNPGMTKVYNLPAGLLTGLQLKFQAIGFDQLSGIFATNCEVRQF